jgi:hypothetical protein
MAYKLEIRGEAEEEIFEAYKWYEEQSPGLGSGLLRNWKSYLKK